MKTTKVIPISVLFLVSTLKIAGQTSVQKKDSFTIKARSPHYWHFEKEKGGAVCTDGLEKLELGLGINPKKQVSSVQILQLHFDGPYNTSGRIFVQGNQEVGEHFLGGTLDVTPKKFYIHAAYTFGLDQVHFKSDTAHQSTYATFIGPGLTFYPSDMKLFHPVFHILRFGATYEKLTRINSIKEEDRKLGNHFAYNIFFQTQSFERKDRGGKIYLEGAFKFRGEESFTEFLIRYRNDKIAEGLINFGFKFDWKGKNFNSISFVTGLNLTRQNTAHM